MKVPDKIKIVRFYDTAELSDYWVLENRTKSDDIEYIRKEALIEWLEGKMTIEGTTEGFVGGYNTALKDVIDKINSL